MTSWTAADAPDQTGRTAVVTGANSGLGLQTTLALARKGARVLMACRDPQRGAAALQRVHRMGKMHFEDLQSERSYSRWGAYGQSKLANLLFARELGRRCPSLLVAAAHPGYAATHLQNGHGSALLAGVMKVGNAVLAQSDEAGALPSVYAATMPDVRPGDYWGPRRLELRGAPKRVARSRAACDDVAARRLWVESERLTGFAYPAAA